MTQGSIFPAWLTDLLKKNGITLWGAADLREFNTPPDATGQPFPLAISFAIPMDPNVMASIKKGPNQQYADEY